MAPKMEVITPARHWNLPVGAFTNAWISVDVLWSPDSSFVALTGSINSSTESVLVFAITDAGPRRIDDATLQPLRDMFHRFPPCRARNVDLQCPQDPKDASFNFAAIDWVDTHTLVLMGEVPCDPRWGGIMCQATGYEVDLPSGRIMRAMSARELKARWQSSMAWKFRVPKRPEWKQ